MRVCYAVCVICTILAGCKNNGTKTSRQAESSSPKIKQIIVGANKEPVKPDFQILEMTNENDILTVVFQYSGGCEQHDFEAHFSGAWLKSLPPQAVLDFEHLNPNNDSCRSMVKDTVKYYLTPLKYPNADKVIIKYTNEKRIETVYDYTR